VFPGRGVLAPLGGREGGMQGCWRPKKMMRGLLLLLLLLLLASGHEGTAAPPL